MAQLRHAPTTHAAPAGAPPHPTADAPPIWCRGLGTHAWRIMPPMLVLPSQRIKVTLTCDRCGSDRVDQWAPKTGAIEGRSYAYTEAYATLLEEPRDKTRLGLITDGKPQPISADVRKKLTKPTEPTTKKTGDGDGKRSGLQLVSTRGKGGVRHGARRGKGRARTRS